MPENSSSSWFRTQFKEYFIYFAIMLSLVVLFKPGGDGPLPFPGADKVIHALTFGLLGLGLWLRRLTWRIVFGALAIYAVSSEIIQRFFIPGREFELFDILADLVGTLITLFLTRFSKVSSRVPHR